MRSCLLLWKTVHASAPERLNAKNIIPVFLLLFFSQLIFAQGRLQGKVTSGDTAVANVTVQIKGTNTATQTDNNGNFSIAASPDATLVVSAIGFTTQEIRVNNQSTINVSLQPNLMQLEQ